MYSNKHNMLNDTHNKQFNKTFKCDKCVLHNTRFLLTIQQAIFEFFTQDENVCQMKWNDIQFRNNTIENPAM